MAWAGLGTEESIRRASVVCATSTIESPLEGYGTLSAVDDNKSGLQGPRGILRVALASSRFDYFVSAITVLNALVIGLEQSCRLEGADCSAFEQTETAMVVFYFLELVAVLFACGLQALRSTWVRVDAFLVLTGLLSQILLAIQHQHLGKFFKIVQLGKYFKILRLLRMARALRLAKTMRAVVRFRELCMLAQGFLNSLNMLVHTLLLGLALLYACSCIAMELIPLSVKESGEELSEELRASLEGHFRSLPVTMLTLLQFFSFDSSHAIYRPWVEASPATAFFFITALLVMGVIFMNLVTAVIINSALENAMQDHEMQRAVVLTKRKALLQNLKDAFKEADENGSGELCKQELMAVCRKHRCLMHGVLGGRGDAGRLFDYLDVDGSGEIGINEFCSGIEDLVFSEAPLEIKRIERMVESVREQLKQSVQLQTSLQEESLKLQELLARPAFSPAKADVEGFNAALQGEPDCLSWTSTAPTTTPPRPAWASEILESLTALACRVEGATSAWAELARPEALEQVASLAAAEALREAWQVADAGSESFEDSCNLPSSAPSPVPCSGRPWEASARSACQSTGTEPAGLAVWWPQ